MARFLLALILLIFFLVSSCSPKYPSVGKSELNVVYDLFDPNLTSESDVHLRIMETAVGFDSYRLQDMRSVLGGLNSIIQASQDERLIQYQVALIDDIVRSARVASEIPENISPFEDEYKGWVSLDPFRLYGEEIVLNEGYSFFYIAEFLYYQLRSGWVNLSRSNQVWWEENVRFLEEHIWTKWYIRSIRFHGNPHRYFLRGRAHMGSHWAGVAMYLEKITNNVAIQAQCRKLRKSYDFLLRKNLKPHPLDKAAFAWNSTYDDVTGTFAVKVDESLIQDVSHGNHVVSYIVAAYKMGSKSWDRNDIQSLCNTVKVLYNKDENRFADNVDGSASTRRPGWGNFQADGWVKLSYYDEDVRRIFDAFGNDVKILNKYRQNFQFYLNFLPVN